MHRLDLGADTPRVGPEAGLQRWLVEMRRDDELPVRGSLPSLQKVRPHPREIRPMVLLRQVAESARGRRGHLRLAGEDRQDKINLP